MPHGLVLVGTLNHQVCLPKYDLISADHCLKGSASCTWEFEFTHAVKIFTITLISDRVSRKLANGRFIRPGLRSHCVREILTLCEVSLSCLTIWLQSMSSGSWRVSTAPSSFSFRLRKAPRRSSSTTDLDASRAMVIMARKSEVFELMIQMLR